MDYKDFYADWLKNVNEDQKKELEAIKDNDKEIRERFTIPLAFGTAGMRGIICMGISNMNEYTVARATKGLADYISSLGEAEKKRGVAISYDTRRMSFDFALTTAQVLGYIALCRYYQSGRSLEGFFQQGYDNGCHVVSGE